MKGHYKTVYCCLLICVFAGFAANTAGTSDLYCSFRSMGYYPYYTVDELPPDQIRYDKLTDIIFFSVYPDVDGNLLVTRLNQEDPNATTDLIRLAHENNVNVSLCVGGANTGSENFGTVVADPIKRAIMINQLVDFTLDNGFDGINLDWEPITDPDNYALFISELKTAMEPNSLELSVDVYLQSDGIKSEVFDLIDQLHIMAYYLHETLPHSTYEEAISGLEYWDGLGFPRSKTILGLPFFGKDTTLSTPSDYFPYDWIVSNYHPAPDVDQIGGINFNGIDTIKAKTQYVLENGYGGVMFWELSNDTTDETSLLTAITEAVQLYGPPDFNCDNVIDILDLSHLMTYWLMDGCVFGNTWCQRSDLDLSEEVNILDFALFSQHWKPLQGDINDDSHVNLSDFTLMAEDWLWTGLPGSIQEDINIDGCVNMKDYAIIAENWLIR